jgi:hypothetical protein
LLLCSAGNPEVVASGIEYSEVRQAPRAVLKVLLQRPSCRYDPVALGSDVIYLEHQFHAIRRPSLRGEGRTCSPGSPDVHRAPPQRNVRVRIATLILGNAEPEDPRVEVDDDIQILRKNLKPQRHVHPRMFAHPSRTAMGATRQSCPA